MSDIQVQLVRGAMCWRSGLKIDADGSPRAYHPDSKLGLDFLANAGHPGNWWGVACDDRGVPYVQSAQDPAPGFFVSTTSLYDPNYLARDPRRYVDSESVPYVTATRDMVRRGARTGDVAVVCYAGRTCEAVVADVGPHPGEGSIALANALKIPANPRHGGVSAPAVSFVLFCGSSPRPSWPRSFAGDGFRLFDAWGGAAALAAALA